MKTVPKKSLAGFAAVLSIFTTVAFHFPFFKYAIDHAAHSFNGVLIIASLCLLMPLANFLVYFLLMQLGRIVGRIIIAFSFICDAVTLYFINTYDVIVDDTMMGNVFNTNTAEATSYWSPAALLYIVLLGVLPALYTILRKVEYPKWKKFGITIGADILAIGVIAFGNMANWMWIDKNATVLGSLLMPWSYTVNTFRYAGEVRERGRKEIPLPDAQKTDDGKTALVIMIGESARRANFSLYGYERQTNPLLENTPGVKAYKAVSAATYTTAGVKAILDWKETSKLYEILPNYLYRNGCDVQWRANNWGEPPLHIEKYYDLKALQEQFPGADPQYDAILAQDLKGAVTASGKDKVVIFLHTSTSHGPTYYKKYPPEFQKFTPITTQVEMAGEDPAKIVNSYDNSILYTDYLIHNVIEQMKGLEGWKTGVIYVSDHGESLGENNLYMHGVPISIAPKEQYEIPFIMWSSEQGQGYKDEDIVTQYSVFHSTLHFLGLGSEIYNEELNLYL